jgi:hypothetical protein
MRHRARCHELVRAAAWRATAMHGARAVRCRHLYYYDL